MRVAVNVNHLDIESGAGALLPRDFRFDLAAGFVVRSRAQYAQR